MERDKRKENQDKLMKNSKKVYFIYSITFAILFSILMAFWPKFDLLFGIIGLIGGLLLGIFIAAVVKMVINKKEEVKKYFGINVTLNETEILICIISLFSFEMIFESLGNPYLFDFLGIVVGIFVGWIIVKLIRKLKSSTKK